MTAPADLVVLRPALEPMAAAEAMAPLSLRREGAAAALGVSTDTFDRHVRPRVPVVYIGGVRVYPVADLIEFLADRATVPAQAVAG